MRLIPATHTRKAHNAMILTQQSSPRPRRLRAALIGLGLDSGDDDNRLTRGDQSLILGGSAETHAELQDTALKMERELDRAGGDWAISIPPSSLISRPPSTYRNSTKLPCGSRRVWSSKDALSMIFRRKS